ncbi:NAD(P)/FAD-dependent oxidoreductase [Nocardia transvalensis]|uniref:NAD(P)/FAD-dependent oxidoreductase n=1 Tax=Nocardia transvalensis TaxID=37333 RepID=UPI0018947E56|nr:FAD-dependent monooxygenase [Nocardia transvalensis]MBF6330700.1 FAD-dependent monooxygenase [Nocardia transvalensis]
MTDSPVAAVEEAEVVVVGGRCAGAATAIALARAGRQVVVVDSAHFPSDTLSTHLLWPGGVAELQRLGALDRVATLGAPPLRVAFAAGAGHRVRSRFTALEGIDYALCVRRTGLDAALVETAVGAGVEVRERARVTELVWSRGRCRGVRYVDRGGAVIEVRAALVVGADGRRSTVARLAGVEQPIVQRPSGRDCYYAYWRDRDDSWRQVAAQWRAGPDLGTAFPCDDGLLLCLVQPPAVAGPSGAGAAERRYRAAIHRIPELRARLDGCERMSRVRSATGIASYFRRSSGPGWALPGDAGHFKDPVTAQGIRDALRYGRILGERAAPVLDDADALDSALTEWERLRIAECVGVYQWTNRLARAEPMTPLEIELYRSAAADESIAAAFTEVFSRIREPNDVLGVRRAALLAVGAAWRSRANLGAIVADLGRQVRDMAAERLESECLVRRSTRPVPIPPAARAASTRITASSRENHA